MGTARFAIMQKGDVVYQYYGHKYLRWEGDTNRRSFTMQFSRELNGAKDSDANSKKDKVYIKIGGFSEDAMSTLRNDEYLDNCLNKVQVGLLIPAEDVTHDF